MNDQPDPMGEPEWLDADGVSIALRHRSATGDLPTVHWFGGWRSDMRGGKALALDAEAETVGWGMLRHDYSGHGESDGLIEDGTISRWVAQSLAVLDARLAPGASVILAGSSMGAWIALRMVEELRKRGDADRLVGLLLIAPAPDFVTELMEPEMTDAERDELARTGRIVEHSEWSDVPNVWTQAFLEDGAANRTMTGPLDLPCPVHILQGTDDDEVPLAHAERLFALMADADAAMTVVRGGDHRLSRPQDLALMANVVRAMIERGRAASD